MARAWGGARAPRKSARASRGPTIRKALCSIAYLPEGTSLATAEPSEHGHLWDRSTEESMDRDRDDDLTARGVENQAEGKAKDAKGKVKDAVGGLTGDTSLQAEGKLDQAKGKVQDAFGRAQRNLDKDDV